MPLSAAEPSDTAKDGQAWNDIIAADKKSSIYGTTSRSKVSQAVYLVDTFSQAVVQRLFHLFYSKAGNISDLCVTCPQGVTCVFKIASSGLVKPDVGNYSFGSQDCLSVLKVKQTSFYTLCFTVTHISVM